MIIIGGRAAAFDGGTASRDFAQKAACAVVVQPSAKGSFPEKHPQFAGVYWGGVSTLNAEYIVNDADLLVTIGCTWDESSTYGYSIPLAVGKVDVISVDAERGLQCSDGQV